MRGNNKHNTIKYILISILLFFSYIQISRSAREIEYNFDRFFYVGRLYQQNGVPKQELHSKVINYFKEKMGSKSFSELESSSPYNKKIISDSEAYLQQFSFYTTKPLYSLFYSLFYKLKKDPLKASVYLNTLFYFITFLLFWKILSIDLDSLLSLLVTIILFCNSTGYGVLKLGTPDVFSMFWSLWFIYILFFKNSFVLLMVSAILAVFARSDNLILVSVSLIFYFSLYRRYKYLFVIGITGILYFLPTWFDNYYGWKYTFYHTFINFIEYPKSADIHIGVKKYVDVIFKNRQTSDDNESVVFLILGSIYTIYHLIRFKTVNLLHIIPLVVIIIKWIMFPVLWNRFTMLFILIFIAGLVLKSHVFYSKYSSKVNY